ncbi:AraC family transcriptional regulator [Burkholderia metallica]|uniref:AraC family transcriptional regulator n=1 Tax=Burkholderia metallica TaxID=488729 RepID=UPI00145456F3|nr:AraC family transcriptional regulator [Burkholderia metallica]VWB28796.1 AraC family transcriptional regulator [Burkholderia metallica]
MDPLSDVLSLLKPCNRLYASFDTGGTWSLFFPPYNGIKFAAVLQGECWGSVDGMAEPVRLEEGDCFLLNRGSGIVLSADPSLPPQDSSAVLEAIERDGIAIHNGGGDVLLIGAFFSFPDDHAAMLLDALPPFFSFPRTTRQADILRWLLDQLKSELHASLPGGTLVSNHLLHLMLVQMLRLHLATSPSDFPVGLFVALSDRQLRTAIDAMHADPGRRWSLDALARIAGLSRTIFARRFRETVGETPMGYLMRWRMLTAMDRLRHTSESVASIAFALGYQSESAFCTAFKRTTSCSPVQYRRQPPTVDDDTRHVPGRHR